MQDDVNQAIRFHQAGRIAEARGIYERILAADPTRVDARQLLGVIAQQEGRHDEAVRLIGEAVRLEPADASYRSNLALALRSLGRREEAIRELREAVRLAPDYTVAAKNLATLLSETGDPAAAEQAVAAAAAADPGDVRALRRLGVMRAQAGRLAEAVGPLEEAVRLDPSDAATLNNLGVVLKDLGRLPEAEAVLRRAIAAAPGSADAANNLGLALMGLGRLAEAERVMGAALAVAGEHVDLLNNSAVLLKQLGRQPEGEPLLRRALAKSPDDAGALVNLGDLLVAAGRAEEALPLLEKAVTIAPRSPEARNNLALALKALDRDEEATPHLEAALAINPRYLPSIHNLGNNLLATGRAAEGIARFLEVIERDPQNFPAIYSLATVTDHRLGEEAIGKIHALLAKGDLGAEPKQLLHMAAAAAHDREGDHDRGIIHAIASGRLKRALDRRAGHGFSREAHARLIDAIEETFSREAVPTMATSGLETQQPLFVVGMPRSGTTLVEQILASHPLVHGAGETDEIASAAVALGAGRMDGADPVAGATMVANSSVEVGIAGSITNSTLSGLYGVSGTVGGNISNSTLRSGTDDVDLIVAGNIVNSRLISTDTSVSLEVGGSVSQSEFTAGDTVSLAIARTMTSSLVDAGWNASLDVDGTVSRSKIFYGKYGGFFTEPDLLLDVGGDLLNSEVVGRVARNDANTIVNVARDARGVRFASRESDRGERLYTIGRNFQGSIQGASANVFLSVLGSVLKGSSLVTGGNAAVNVARNFDGVVDVDALQFRVEGNVARDSRIVASGVREWQTDFTSFTPLPSFFIGGRLDGIVNVGVFDASPGDITVTILGGGAGKSARFYVGRFETDTIKFQGSFQGNIRVLQDLVADLEFTGSLQRITIGGQVLSDITVGGSLFYLNSNSWFQPLGSGKQIGNFVNGSLRATGTLTTGSYVTVVPVAPPVV
jgi:tetratricopeptide (TPR) repeat protein